MNKLAGELLYLDYSMSKLFLKYSFRILFPMALITRKFSFTFSFRVSNLEILLFLFFQVCHSEILFPLKISS